MNAEREAVVAVTIDEPKYPDPDIALAAYMLLDGYSGSEVQSYLDWAFPALDAAAPAQDGADPADGLAKAWNEGRASGAYWSSSRGRPVDPRLTPPPSECPYPPARQRPTQQAATDRVVEAVEALHRPHTEQSGKIACPTCLLGYPCPTVLAARTARDGADGDGS